MNSVINGLGILIFFILIVLGGYISEFISCVNNNFSMLIILVAFIITIIFNYIYNKKSIKNILFQSIFIIFSVALNACVLDISWDGQAYHMNAIRMLSNGWNIVYNPQGYGYEIPFNIGHDWCIAFPKSLWLFSYVFYKATGNILIGKCYNLLLIVANILFLSFILKDYIKNKLLKYFMVIIVIFNPIVAIQIFSYYNDGTSYLLIISIINLLLIKYLYTNIYYINILLIFFIGISLNIKFTMVGYIFIILFGITVILYMYKLSVFSWLKLCILGVLTGLFILGFNPYITNVVNHGHPFYPLVGTENARNIIKPYAPESFYDKTRLEKLAISLYSRTESSAQSYPELKIPGQFSETEIKDLISVFGSLKGGFGFWYSLGLSISLVIFIFLIIKKKRSKLFLLSILFIFSSVLINPEPWIARYVPQFYIIPIIILAYSVLNINILNKYIKCIVYVAIFVFFINNMVALTGAFCNTIKTEYMVYKVLSNLEEHPKQNLYICFKYFDSTKVSMFKYFNINYIQIKEYKNTDEYILLPGTIEQVRIYY